MAQAYVTETLKNGISLHIEILYQELYFTCNPNILKLTEVMYCALYFIKKDLEKQSNQFHHITSSCKCGIHIAASYNIINLIDRKITETLETEVPEIFSTFVDNFSDCWFHISGGIICDSC